MISFAPSYLSTLFLVAIRLGIILIFTPIQAIRQLPVHVRLILLFILSSILVSTLALSTSIQTETGLIFCALAELANGLILSMSLYAAFAIFQIAGQLIDTQMGLNSLAILNPADHSHEPLSGRLLAMLAVLFFFSINGHHWLIQGLAYSFRVIPPGELALFKGFKPILGQFSLMFSLAVLLASPLVIGLLAVDLCAAILTRNMPQISTYFLTLPLKILLGFILFSLMLTAINPLMEQIFKHCFESWQELMS